MYVDVLYAKTKLTRSEIWELVNFFARNGLVVKKKDRVKVLPQTQEYIGKVLAKFQTTQSKKRKPNQQISRGRYNKTAPKKTPEQIIQPHHKIKKSEIKENIEKNLDNFRITISETWNIIRKYKDDHDYLLNNLSVNSLPVLEQRLAHYQKNYNLSGDDITKAKQVILVMHALEKYQDEEQFFEAFKPFRWPDIQIRELFYRIDGKFEIGDGLLGAFGYHVGISGDDVRDRRNTLIFILEDSSRRPNNYCMNAGPAKSCQRLKVVAYAIAGCIRRAKQRRQADMSQAISDWTNDLTWLKRSFYDDRCDGKLARGFFSWPMV